MYVCALIVHYMQNGWYKNMQLFMHHKLQIIQSSFNIVDIIEKNQIYIKDNKMKHIFLLRVSQYDIKTFQIFMTNNYCPKPLSFYDEEISLTGRN